MWSIRLTWLLGRDLPWELEEAARPLSVSDRLEARRAVRRGVATPTVGTARYAIALARREQPWALVLIAAILCVMAYMTVLNLSRHGINGAALVFAASSVVLARQLIRSLLALRNAPAAEHANTALLERAGQPVAAYRGAPRPRGLP